jgi:hypothetical protein
MVMTEHMVKKCPECGKEFRGRYAGRAYAGHMWLSHFKRVGARGEIVALKQRVTDLVAYNQRLENKCNELQLMQDKAIREAEGVKNSLGVCPHCHKELGNILYHEKVVTDTKLDGKRVVAFKCNID